jgi:hypothetical protein
MQTTGGKPIADCLQSISGVRTVNPLIASYDIHGRNGDVLLFCAEHHESIQISKSGFKTFIIVFRGMFRHVKVRM